MSKKTLLCLLATVFLVTVSTAEAQQPERIARIGILRADSPPPNASVATLDAFRRGLRDLGYVEGKNISVEYRWAEGRYERLPDLAVDLVRLKVDVIFTQATAATHATKQATKTIPIVFVNVSDPVASGFVASLARPGGNITGVTNISSDLSGKQLEVLKESVPGATRVAVLWNPAYRTPAARNGGCGPITESAAATPRGARPEGFRQRIFSHDPRAPQCSLCVGGPHAI